MTNRSLPIAYLLWLFTGVFGGHRWYLGKRWTALFLLIFLTVLNFLLFLISFKVSGMIEVLYTLVDLDLIIFSFTHYEGVFSTFSRTFGYFFVNSWIIGFWACVLLLIHDLFWIKTLTNNRKVGFGQQPVKAFD